MGTGVGGEVSEFWISVLVQERIVAGAAVSGVMAYDADRAPADAGGKEAAGKLGSIVHYANSSGVRDSRAGTFRMRIVADLTGDRLNAVRRNREGR